MGWLFPWFDFEKFFERMNQSLGEKTHFFKECLVCFVTSTRLVWNFSMPIRALRNAANNLTSKRVSYCCVVGRLWNPLSGLHKNCTIQKVQHILKNDLKCSSKTMKMQYVWRILQFIELQIDVHLIRMEYNGYFSTKNLQINVWHPCSRWIQTPGPGLAEMKDSYFGHAVGSLLQLICLHKNRSRCQHSMQKA